MANTVEAGGGEITFDETIDLGGGAKFGGPTVAANTIRLEYGQIVIEDNNDRPQPLSKGLLIHAPKMDDDTKHHVAVTWTKSAFLEGNTKYGSDWSVFNIINTRNPLVTKLPDRINPHHPLYEDVTLGGLQISGGKAEDGAGVSVTGFVNLLVSKTKIWNNNSTRINPAAGTGTKGAGLYAAGESVEPVQEAKGAPGPEAVGGPIEYGPVVTLDQSQVVDNHTSLNDDPNGAPIDQGGGLYMGGHSTLIVTDSTVSFNSSENGGGGIDFGGGVFFENPAVYWDENLQKIVRVPNSPAKLYSTFLKVRSSEIVGNINISAVGKADVGGGVAVRDAAGTMIWDTTIADNKAGRGGAGLHFSGLGAQSIKTGNDPYIPFIGQAYVVASTAELNKAGYTPPGGEDPPIYGHGAGLRVEGGANNFFLVNATLSSNQAVPGSGGGASIVPQTYFYSFNAEYVVNVNTGTIALKAGQDRPFPVEYVEIAGGRSRTEIYNSTIAKNSASGNVLTDNQGMKYVVGGRGGGIAVATDDNGGMDGDVELTSTIIATNTVQPLPSATPGGSGPDIWTTDTGPVTTLSGKGFNLVGVGDNGQFELSGQAGTLADPLDPQLYPLAYNGGHVRTHAIDYFSPAADKGFNVLNLTFDERGEQRERGNRTNGNQRATDVGAYESTAIALVFPTFFAIDDPVTGNKSTTTVYSNQRSMITSIDVFIDPLAAGEVLHVFRTGNKSLGPIGEVPILTSSPVADFFAPWSATVTKVTITFSEAAVGAGYATDLGEFAVNANSLIDGTYKVTVTEPVVPFPGITHVAAQPTFHRLFGDVDGDADVDAVDFGQFRAQFGGAP